MRRTATAVILLAMLAGACEPSLERSQATRSPAGANADARHVVVDTDLAFDDIMALLYLLQRDDVVIDAGPLRPRRPQRDPVARARR